MRQLSQTPQVGQISRYRPDPHIWKHGRLAERSARFRWQASSKVQNQPSQHDGKEHHSSEENQRIEHSKGSRFENERPGGAPRQIAVGNTSQERTVGPNHPWPVTLLT
jgi:hypothetical protein